MGWIAVKEIKILRNGEYIDLRPGDACPEAANWPNIKAWERTKHVKFVEAEEEVGLATQADIEAYLEDIKRWNAPVVLACDPPDEASNTEDAAGERRKFSVRELRKFTKKQMIELASKHGLSIADELKRDAIIDLIKDAQGV